jgi:hypothetical protein
VVQHLGGEGQRAEALGELGDPLDDVHRLSSGPARD